jgi:hypothetical protein
MTITVPTPIPPRPSPNLEHWIWLDPHRPLDKSPIAHDAGATALESMLKESRLLRLEPADRNANRRVLDRLGRYPGPGIIVELAGPRLSVDAVHRRLDPLLWHVERHGWHCRAVAMDPDAGMLCLIPRPDSIQPSLAIAASSKPPWPRLHGLTLAVFPSGFTKGHRLTVAPAKSVLH